jgi:hypothetical protein
MIDMFMKIHENEKNENTAFVLMLGVLSEKMTEIINLLEDCNKKIELIKNDLETVNSQKKELEEKKFYMPLTPEDYD